MKSTGEDLGKLLLRVVLGGLLLFHGAFKLKNGVAWMNDMLTSHGLPTALAYGAYVGEIVAPLLLIFGIFTRAAGLVVAGFMAMAVFLAHTSQFFKLNEVGGWELELQAFYLFSGLAVFLLGAGRYSVGGVHGRWN
jgi:putative oxidoreductase